MLNNIYEVFMNYLNKRNESFIKQQEKIKAKDLTWQANKKQVSMITEDKIEAFFEYLADRNKVGITYASNQISNPLLNNFYNEFFSKYYEIDINGDIVIGYSNISDDVFDNCLLIGRAFDEDLYIKEKQIKNGLFVSFINDSKENFEQENTGYLTIYHFLVETILNEYWLTAEKEYIDFLNKNSTSN